MISDDGIQDHDSLHKVQKIIDNYLQNDVCYQRVADTSNRNRLKEELKDVMSCSVLYVSHLLHTKHQGDYQKFVLNNLQPGEAVVIIDYKMKLELGVRLREIQRLVWQERHISPWPPCHSPSRGRKKGL